MMLQIGIPGTFGAYAVPFPATTTKMEIFFRSFDEYCAKYLNRSVDDFRAISNFYASSNQCTGLTRNGRRCSVKVYTTSQDYVDFILGDHDRCRYHKHSKSFYGKYSKTMEDV